MPSRELFAAGPDLHARIFGFILERIGRAVRLAAVEPQAVFVRAGRLVEAGLVDQAVPSEAVAAVGGEPFQPSRLAVLLRQFAVLGRFERLVVGIAAVADMRIRRQYLQEVEGAERVVGHVVPEAIVAAGPHDPGIAALHLVLVELDARIGVALVAAVHVGEVVLGGRREAFRGAAGAHRLVLHRPRLLFAAAGHRGDAETCGETREQLAKSHRSLLVSPDRSFTRAASSQDLPGRPSAGGRRAAPCPLPGCCS